MRSFFNWLVDSGQVRIDQRPNIPKINAHAAYRKIIPKEIQKKILNEIFRISWEFNPKIYLGCLWLSTYINVRPSELIKIKEKHIDLDNERIHIPHPKEGEPKYIFLLPQDVNVIKEFKPSFPELYFFRHKKGNGAAKPNTKFGRDYLQRWWNKACSNLNIKGVSLYPGTRHSTAVDLRKRKTPESIKRTTGHKNNRAFERYLQVTGDELRQLYTDTRTDNKLITLPVASGKK